MLVLKGIIPENNYAGGACPGLRPRGIKDPQTRPAEYYIGIGGVSEYRESIYLKIPGMRIPGV